MVRYILSNLGTSHIVRLSLPERIPATLLRGPDNIHMSTHQLVMLFVFPFQSTLQ